MRETLALLVIDVQERLFPHIKGKVKLLSSLQKAMKGFSALQIPVIVSEQVPSKMGKTLPELPSCPHVFEKSAFSCLGEQGMEEELKAYNHFVLVGIETHVCVIQTARDLLKAGKKVTVLLDAVGSRSKVDFFSALNEMQLLGVRLTTVETILFELLKTAEAKSFRAIKDIVK